MTTTPDPSTDQPQLSSHSHPEHPEHPSSGVETQNSHLGPRTRFAIEVWEAEHSPTPLMALKALAQREFDHRLEAQLSSPRLPLPACPPSGLPQEALDLLSEAEAIVEELYNMRALTHKLREAMLDRALSARQMSQEKPWLSHPLGLAASRRMGELNRQLVDLGTEER